MKISAITPSPGHSFKSNIESLNVSGAARKVHESRARRFPVLAESRDVLSNPSHVAPYFIPLNSYESPPMATIKLVLTDAAGAKLSQYGREVFLKAWRDQELVFHSEQNEAVLRASGARN